MDWNDLQRLTADSLHIYEALRRAERLSEEGERLLKEAEDLLRRAALAYLLEPLPPESLPVLEGTLAGAMANAWVQVQQAWVDLKDALYRLARGTTEENKETACSILTALLQVEPGYRDGEALLTEFYLREAQARFSKREWDEGRAILLDAMITQPVDKKRCRLAVLESFVDEPNLEGLAEFEPRVRKLSAFQKAEEAWQVWESVATRIPSAPRRWDPILRTTLPDLCDPDYMARMAAWDEAMDSANFKVDLAKNELKSVLSILVFGEKQH